MMICPFCQAELDETRLMCPRCGAAYPHSGGTLRFNLRNVIIGSVALVLMGLILTTCVLNQFTAVPSATPDLKSADAQRVLMMLQNGQQDTQNATLIRPKERR